MFRPAKFDALGFLSSYNYLFKNRCAAVNQLFGNEDADIIDYKSHRYNKI